MKNPGTHVATPRRASTVILVREAGDRLQVYLLKRSARSEFMPGNFVFPGGMVEPLDDAPDFWSDRVDTDVEALLRPPAGGMDPRDFLAHAVAAIRETLEEAGVFLGPIDADLPDCRRGPAEGQGPSTGVWFRDWVLAGGRTLGVSRLHPWAHWITPVVQPKRFDTRFFLSFVPEEAKCSPDAEETTQGVWVSARVALQKNEQGSVPLSPPTLVTLHELLPYNDRQSLEGALRTRCWGPARVPRLGNVFGGAVIFLPWDSDYGPDAGENRGAAGVPFSRLRFDGKLWHAVPMGPFKG